MKKYKINIYSCVVDLKKNTKNNYDHMYHYVACSKLYDCTKYIETCSYFVCCGNIIKKDNIKDLVCKIISNLHKIGR